MRLLKRTLSTPLLIETKAFKKRGDIVLQAARQLIFIETSNFLKLEDLDWSFWRLPIWRVLHKTMVSRLLQINTLRYLQVFVKRWILYYACSPVNSLQHWKLSCHSGDIECQGLVQYLLYERCVIWIVRDGGDAKIQKFFDEFDTDQNHVSFVDTRLKRRILSYSSTLQLLICTVQYEIGHPTRHL